MGNLTSRLLECGHNVTQGVDRIRDISSCETDRNRAQHIPDFWSLDGQPRDRTTGTERIVSRSKLVMSDNWLVKQQHEDIKLLSAENKRLEAKVKRMEIELQDLKALLERVS